MRKLFGKYKEQILYLIFGLVTTVINFVVYWAMTRLINFDAYISNIVAWVGSVMFAFITNKFIVFNSIVASTKKIVLEIIGFIGARLFSLFAEMIIIYIGVSVLGANDLLVKLFTNIIVIALNYIFSKFLIFKKWKWLLSEVIFYWKA